MKEKSADKISVAQSVIDLAYRSHRHNRVAVLWSGGKDSTALLHLILKRYGKIPFRVVFGDLNFENRELTEFIGNISGTWSFRIHKEGLLSKKEAAYFQSTRKDKTLMSLVDRRHMQSMRQLSSKLGIQAFILGNRRSENKRNTLFVKKSKGIEYYYPLIQLSDLEMWEYVYVNRVPFLGAYLRGIRRTSPLMFLRRPSVINHAAAIIMHTWFKIKFQILRRI